jgi:predicted DsbA family dithiol-disulfide isomerase
MTESRDETASTRRLQVEVFSDYTCPWCYIGHARLERLRRQERGVMELDVTWRPFEIHPEVPEDGMPVEELHYSREQWKTMMGRLREQAEDEGLEIGDRPFVSNTHEALMAGTRVQAERPDRFPTFHEGLFRAYFSEGRDLGDRSVILDVARQSGLDPDELDAALDRGDGEDALEAVRRRIRPGEMLILVVGDAGEVRKPLEALGLGPVEVVDPATLPSVPS